MIKKENNRYFGKFGGAYVPEMLYKPLKELETFFEKSERSRSFQRELNSIYKNFSGRPTPLCFAKNLTRELNGPDIFLKLESHNHTGAHKINNALGQALIAKKMGKSRVIAETGAGQHGLAVSCAAAKLNLDCTIFMGEKDIQRQYPNVFHMQQMGAVIRPVSSGSSTLKDAVSDAIKEWAEDLDNSFYIIGSALGPSPYPYMVRQFQSVIGLEVAEQLNEYSIRLPDYLIACAGGGSNALGLFTPFIDFPSVRMLCAEAGGKNKKSREHAMRFSKDGRAGIAQGFLSIFLQDEEGQLQNTRSISAGLDYAGIGPELAYLESENRVSFYGITDKEALEAYSLLSRTEGIIPALESSHAIALCMKSVQKMKKGSSVVINISGRGDKDLFITAPAIDPEKWTNFLKGGINNV